MSTNIFEQISETRGKIKQLNEVIMNLGDIRRRQGVALEAAKREFRRIQAADINEMKALKVGIEEQKREIGVLAEEARKHCESANDLTDQIVADFTNHCSTPGAKRHLNRYITDLLKQCSEVRNSIKKYSEQHSI